MTVNEMEELVENFLNKEPDKDGSVTMTAREGQAVVGMVAYIYHKLRQMNVEGKVI